MIVAGFDTNVIVGAIFWPAGTARHCLAGLARRQYALALTREVFDEYQVIVARFQPDFPVCNSNGTLSWLRLKGRWVEPAPLGKPRSRDLEDDPFLACGLAAHAKYLVTRDQDLLVLGKPFGIQTISPGPFLAWLRGVRAQG